jgi:neutral amino acid transport system permease protein
VNWDLILRNFVGAFFGDFAMIYALAAIGLNLHFGYTGLLNFGHVGFMMVGAYGVAIGVTYFGLSLWLGLLLGGLGAVVLALLLGLPTLRLRADYLAIVTIVAGEILRLSFRSVAARNVTGGSFGLTAFARDFYALNIYSADRYDFGIVSFSNRALWVMTVGWTVVGLAALFTYMLMHSPWGRVLRAIREDEDAVRSLGKNVYYYKMQSLVLGGVLGAMGGMFLAINTQSVQPDVYSPPVTFFVFTALIIGGAATTLGPIIGAMVFWGLLSATENLLRQAVGAGYIPTWLMSGTQVGQVRFMLVGLGLMLLMIFRPQGIFGDRRELQLDQ